MLRVVISAYFLCAACGVVEQPKSARTVAAYEVPLPTDADKVRFLELLSTVAKANGYHVDAVSPSELKAMSEVSPITFNAAVWRGNDEEAIVSAMDFQDHIGRVWIGFSLGESPSRSALFREALVSRIKEAWPGTMSLPIMPSGAIPLTDDLIRTPDGYAVKPSEASKYSAKSR